MIQGLLLAWWRRPLAVATVRAAADGSARCWWDWQRGEAATLVRQADSGTLPCPRTQHAFHLPPPAPNPSHRPQAQARGALGSQASGRQPGRRQRGRGPRRRRRRRAPASQAREEDEREGQAEEEAAAEVRGAATQPGSGARPPTIPSVTAALLASPAAATLLPVTLPACSLHKVSRRTDHWAVGASWWGWDRMEEIMGWCEENCGLAAAGDLCSCMQEGIRSGAGRSSTGGGRALEGVVVKGRTCEVGGSK